MAPRVTKKTAANVSRNGKRIESICMLSRDPLNAAPAAIGPDRRRQIELHRREAGAAEHHHGEQTNKFGAAQLGDQLDRPAVEQPLHQQKGDQEHQRLAGELGELGSGRRFAVPAQQRR